MTRQSDDDVSARTCSYKKCADGSQVLTHGYRLSLSFGGDNGHGGEYSPNNNEGPAFTHIYGGTDRNIVV